MDRISLGEIASLVGGRVIGNPGREVVGVASIEDAGEHQIAFLASKRYVRFLEECSARAFLVYEGLSDTLSTQVDAVAVDDPYPALQRLLVHLQPKVALPVAVHGTAVLGPGVSLGAGVSIGPYAVLEAGVTVGEASIIGAHVVLGAGTTLGAKCRLHPQVVTYQDTLIGDEVTIHSGVRLGADGFGYTLVEGRHLKIPQLGRCVIGDRVEIGANSAIDRGSLGDTHVGEGVKIDNLVHVAHNVRIGAQTLLAALVGIAGSTRIGERGWFGGQSGAINQLEIGDDVKVTVQAGITRDVPDGATMFGFPARPRSEGLRKEASLAVLPRLRARVSELERDVNSISRKLSEAGEGSE